MLRKAHYSDLHAQYHFSCDMALGTSKQLRQCGVYTGALEKPMCNGHWAYFRFLELFFFLKEVSIFTPILGNFWGMKPTSPLRCWGCYIELARPAAF